MLTTKKASLENAVAVNAVQLAELLNVGRYTAERIGRESGARVQIGKRVLYSVKAVEEYLARMAAEQAESN